MRQILAPYLPTLLMVLSSITIATASSVIAKYNPAAGPPPWYLVPLIVVRNLLTARAPAGTVGIAGTGWSVPLAHYPRKLTPGMQYKQPPPGASPRALLPLCLLALGVSSCTPAQVQAWKTAGIGAATCAAPAVVNAAGDALTELLTQAAGAAAPLDYKQMGIDLAAKYGSAAAICAVGKAWAVLGPTILGKPSRAATAVGWLVQHMAEWKDAPPKHVIKGAPPPITITNGTVSIGSGPGFTIWQGASIGQTYTEICYVDADGEIHAQDSAACLRAVVEQRARTRSIPPPVLLTAEPAALPSDPRFVRPGAR